MNEKQKKYLVQKDKGMVIKNGNCMTPEDYLKTFEKEGEFKTINNNQGKTHSIVMGYEIYNDNYIVPAGVGTFPNAHLSYKGRSIVVDYEHILHVYFNIPQSYVPYEIYPYNGDAYLDYAPLDKKLQKVDISNLLEKVDELLNVEEK